MTTRPRLRRKTNVGPSGPSVRVWSTIDRARWSAVRRRVFARDGHRCRRCGRAGRLECDHVRPLVDFPGQNAYALEGLQTLCRACHISKTRAENRARHPVRPEVAAWRAMVQELTDPNLIGPLVHR